MTRAICRSQHSRLRRIGSCLALSAALALPLAAGPPPIATDDTADHPGFAFVVDVLANDHSPAGLALSVQLQSSTCSGTVFALHDRIGLEPSPNGVSQSCQIQYRVVDEDGGTATAWLVLHELPGLFADGFEAGSTAGWSEVTP